MKGLHTRTDIEAEIERLIGVLDLMDGEADDEPALGWTAITYSTGSTDDREDDAGDDREMDDDREWSLGRCECLNQANAHHGADADLEACA